MITMLVLCIFSYIASTVSASASATGTPQSPPPTGEMLCLTLLSGVFDIIMVYFM